MRSNKKVTFSTETKKFDGISNKKYILYAKLFINFMKGSVKSVRCVTQYTKSLECIQLFLFETKTLKEKLINLVEFEDYSDLYHSFYEEDPYWDCSYFVEKALEKKRKGIPIVRNGSNISGLNIILKMEHLTYVNKFIELLEDVEEFLFFDL
jgi:hypothetical protein